MGATLYCTFDEGANVGDVVGAFEGDAEGRGVAKPEYDGDNVGGVVGLFEGRVLGSGVGMPAA